MKRTVLVALLILVSLGFCFAQGPKEAIRLDPRKAAGSYYVYDNVGLPALTPVPKGYKPFYISHFSRHGARCCMSEYDSVYVWFSKAAGAGVLTDAGKDFLSRYEPYYRKIVFRKGNLTPVGREQHRSIASNMYKRFPQVFRGSTRVEAVSTESARVIMSMWSFLSRLQSLDGSLDIDADASGRFASWLQPSLPSNPYYLRDNFRMGRAAQNALKEYFCQTVPWENIASRLLSCPGAITDALHTSPDLFIRYLYEVAVSTRCVEEDQGCFDDLFTEEEAFLVWKAISARTFAETANFEVSESRFVDYAAFTLGQIIEAADADMGSGGTQLRLRFGHDSGISPLLALLDVNGYGRKTSSLEEAVSIFPNYKVPMACNIQFVFYRKPGKDVLVKVLLNEREATLPLAPVHGPCYRWEDFKAHYLPIVAASKDRIMQTITNPNK